MVKNSLVACQPGKLEIAGSNPVQGSSAFFSSKLADYSLFLSLASTCICMTLFTCIYTGIHAHVHVHVRNYSLMRCVYMYSDQGGLQTSEGKEQLQTTKKDLKPSVKEVSPAVEKNSNKEKRSSSGIKRRRSEDELELHPAIDWEEEGEGGGKEREGVERPTSRKLSRRSGESKSSQRSGVEEAKVIRTSSGERDGEGREKRRGGKKSDVEERGEKGDDEPAVKHTRTLKVCMYMYTCTFMTLYVCIHVVCSFHM